MPALVLESKFGSRYDDSPSSYEFPKRYLSHFEPLTRGEPIYAVIYEPRGDRQGRMAYVGWALIRTPPRPSGRTAEAGQPLWQVEYTGPAEQFPVAVQRELDNVPIESWLRPLPRGRMRNSATIGRAVRSIPDEEFQLIMQLAYGSVPDLTVFAPRDEHVSPVEAVRERSLRLVDSLQRDARFRVNVLSAYEFKCAVSGFELGRVSKTKPQGLLDAAHIRPVGANGPDDISNGIPLTPTLHRLFDAGLFTLDFEDDRPRILTSPSLEPAMLVGRDGDFRLPLQDGLPLLVPPNRASWPSRDQVRYHQREVFQAS